MFEVENFSVIVKRSNGKPIEEQKKEFGRIYLHRGESYYLELKNNIDREAQATIYINDKSPEVLELPPKGSINFRKENPLFLNEDTRITVDFIPKELYVTKNISPQSYLVEGKELAAYTPSKIQRATATIYSSQLYSLSFMIHPQGGASHSPIKKEKEEEKEYTPWYDYTNQE